MPSISCSKDMSNISISSRHILIDWIVILCQSRGKCNPRRDCCFDERRSSSWGILQLLTCALSLIYLRVNHLSSIYITGEYIRPSRIISTFPTSPIRTSSIFEMEKSEPGLGDFSDLNEPASNLHMPWKQLVTEFQEGGLTPAQYASFGRSPLHYFQFHSFKSIKRANT